VFFLLNAQGAEVEPMISSSRKKKATHATPPGPQNRYNQA
jgi:hypothetical protein